MSKDKVRHFSKKISVSVIVPFRNESFHIIDLIDHLRSQVFHEPFEVIMIDNNDHDSIYRSVIESSGFTYIRGPNIPDADSARNFGIRQAQGEVIAFTDCDCRPSRYWLAKGIQLIRQQPGHIIAGKVCFFGLRSFGHFFDAQIFLDQEDAVLRRGSCYFANVFIEATKLKMFLPIPEGYCSGSDVYFFRSLYDKEVPLFYGEQAVVFHAARNCRELLRKSYRIGMSRGMALIFPLLNRQLVKGKIMLYWRKPLHIGLVSPVNFSSETIYTVTWVSFWFVMILAAILGFLRGLMKTLVNRCQSHRENSLTPNQIGRYS